MMLISHTAPAITATPPPPLPNPLAPFCPQELQAFVHVCGCVSVGVHGCVCMEVCVQTDRHDTNQTTEKGAMPIGGERSSDIPMYYSDITSPPQAGYPISQRYFHSTNF